MGVYILSSHSLKFLRRSGAAVVGVIAFLSPHLNHRKTVKNISGHRNKLKIRRKREKAEGVVVVHISQVAPALGTVLFGLVGFRRVAG